jgi:hypothetical protein
MLNDTKIKSLKPKDKKYLVADTEGLTLLIMPTGTKSWIVRYRFNGKQKEITIGQYPELSLSDAREKLKTVKATLSLGQGEFVL